VSRRVWSAAAAAVIGVQVGSAMVATRFVVDQTGPASLAYGLRSIPSARAALIFATFPLLTSLVATALGRERLTSAVVTISGCGRCNHATPTQVTVFLALSPVTAACLGAWLLAEPISPLLAVGLISVVGGLALAHRRSREDRGIPLDSERGRAL